MLMVSPWKGVVYFGKRGKLNPRYIGPFKVLAKKCLSDEPLAILLDEVHIDDKLRFVEEPVKVLSSPGNEKISFERSIRNSSQQTYPQQMPHLEPCEQGFINEGRRLWVSLVHCVPKKGGMTIVQNEDNELIPTSKCCLGATKDQTSSSYTLCEQDYDGCSSTLHYDEKRVTSRSVYAFEKLRPYLVLSKTIVYTDHSALKYLLAKQDAKPRLLRWILLLQKFDVITRDKKGAKNLAADHLSRLENPHQDELEKKETTKTFPLETLGMIAFYGDSSTPMIKNPKVQSDSKIQKGKVVIKNSKFSGCHKNYQNQIRNQGNNHGIPQGNNQGRNQFFQGDSHGQNPPPTYQAHAYQAPSYQAPVHQAPILQPQVVTTTKFTNYMKANDAILKNMQTNMTSLTNSNLELKNMFGQFIKMNTALSSGSGTLPSNTITNPKEDLKGITTRSGNAYKGPTIPTTSSPPKVVERETDVTKETVPPTPVSAPKPNSKPSIPYPSRLHDQKLRDKTNDQKEKFFQIFKDLDINISFADALILMPKFGSTIKSLLTNKEKLFELARTPLNEHCSAVLLKKLPEKLGDLGKFLIPCDFLRMDECLALADLGASINLMPLFVWNKLSLPELSPTCMTLELADRSISHILLLDEFLNDDPSSPPLPPQELKVVEPTKEKSSIDEPPVVELKDLPPHLEYAFLEGDDKLPVIIAKELKDVEKTALIKVLKSHKQALAWQLSDIKGINPKFHTHKILMEDDFKPGVQHQRRVNPKIHEVIKKEVLKLLDAELIYPILDSLWVSPVHCV
nr:reverse transcriptase domain-containing protein [Tanacetum cinerariifolium]